LALSSDQLNELIDDLLAYSHLERRPVNRSDFSIKEIISIVLDERKNDLAQNNFQVHQQIDDEIIYNSSAELVTQILRSYLDNSIKFASPEGDRKIWISYTHDTANGIVTLRDNGIGFDPKYNDRIFDVFYRLHRIDEFSGTGIGLALAKKAANILGYRVWASGKINNGSSFFLEIKKIT
jgi:light-regulated signal transduction histidine kinase (bacteriophytochrome)